MALLLCCASAGAAPVESNTRRAPSFRIRDLEGRTLVLDSLRARGPVLVDFWATWCKPCLAALPELEAIHRRLGPRGLSVIGISVDGPRNYSRVRPFVRRMGMRFPIALDENGALQEAWQVRAVPTTFLIGRDGAVVEVVQGYRPGDAVALERKIVALLDAPDSTAAPAPR